jgi:hypothetical protein
MLRIICSNNSSSQGGLVGGTQKQSLLIPRHLYHAQLLTEDSYWKSKPLVFRQSWDFFLLLNSLQEWGGTSENAREKDHVNPFSFIPAVRYDRTSSFVYARVCPSLFQEGAHSPQCGFVTKCVHWSLCGSACVCLYWDLNIQHFKIERRYLFRVARFFVIAFCCFLRC